MTDHEPTRRYEVLPGGEAPIGPPPAAPGPPEPAAPPAPPAGPGWSSPSAPTQPVQPVAAADPAEPADAWPTFVPPAPTQPVAPATSSPPGRGWIRWLIAVAVSLLVVGTAAGATYLLTREAGDPDVLAWTPADSVAYAELRLDLPGSQEAELAKVMSAFPGFDDQAAFPTKLSEALDQLVKRVSDGKVSYQVDIEPWFGGQVALSMGPLPTTTDAMASRGLILAGVTDGAKASAWADKLLSEAGATTTTETYKGITITTVAPPRSGAAGTSAMAGAYAVLGPVIAIGDEASVKAAIDTGGTSGLATNEQFTTASSSVSGDRLAFVYVDSGAIIAGAQALAGDAGAAMPQLPTSLTDLSVPWTAAALTARDGAFVVESRTPHRDKLGPATTAESKLPAVLPPTTVALVEGHDVGASIERLKSLLASDPSLADGIKQVDDALALVGGFGSIVDWMGEAGVAVTRSGDGVAGGLVIVPTDASAAGKLFTQLRGLLALGGASAGVTVTDETYGDATISVVDLGSSAGAALGIPVPSLGGNLSIAYAVTGDVVVIGSGTDFVKAVLDARSGDSLAKSARFQDALGKVDKAHGALLWLDVAAARDLLEGQIPAAGRSDYEANVKPYLDPVDYVIGTSTPGDDVDRGTLVLSVTSS